MNILKARTRTKVEAVEWCGSQTHHWHENYIKIIYFNAFFVITRWGKNSFPLMIPSCTRTLLVLNPARMRRIQPPTHMVISLKLPFVVCECCLLLTPCHITRICIFQYLYLNLANLCAAFLWGQKTQHLHYWPVESATCSLIKTNWLSDH